MKTGAADASRSQQGLFIGVTRKRGDIFADYFLHRAKNIQGRWEITFSSQWSTWSREGRGGEKKNVNELVGAGKGKRWIEAREIQRRNRTETSISSSCHSLFLYFSTSVALSRENIACFSFFSKLSLGWIRIDRNARAENDRSRPNCLRVATKTFRAEGGFRVAETVARFCSRCVSNREKVAAIR